jgi:hypothetical protein
MSQTDPDESLQPIVNSDATWRAELMPEQCRSLRSCIEGVALKHKPEDG